MKTHDLSNYSLFLAGLSLALCMQTVIAEETGEEDELLRNTKDIVYRAQNPLSANFKIPLNYTYHGGANNGGVSVGSLEPIFPVALGDWNLINQLSLNFIGTSGGVTGIAELPQLYSNKDAAGLGDLGFTTYLTPADSGMFSWGLGPTLVFPSDHPSRELGSGKFSIGPALMFVTQPKPWSLGLNIKQIWSVAGNLGRDDVSQMVLRPFINYNFNDGWYLVSDMDMIANWNSVDNERWTVPIGGGFGKVLTFNDSNAINTRLEGYYNPIRPDEAPEWSVNFSLQYIFAD